MVQGMFVPCVQVIPSLLEAVLPVMLATVTNFPFPYVIQVQGSTVDIVPAVQVIEKSF